MQIKIIEIQFVIWLSLGFKLWFDKVSQPATLIVMLLLPSSLASSSNNEISANHLHATWHSLIVFSTSQLPLCPQLFSPSTRCFLNPTRSAITTPAPHRSCLIHSPNANERTKQMSWVNYEIPPGQASDTVVLLHHRWMVRRQRHKKSDHFCRLYSF